MNWDVRITNNPKGLVRIQANDNELRVTDASGDTIVYAFEQPASAEREMLSPIVDRATALLMEIEAREAIRKEINTAHSGEVMSDIYARAICGGIIAAMKVAETTRGIR